MTLILGIESSCDETSAAVISSAKSSSPHVLTELKILSDCTARQEEVHLRFGGVVPELASRRHLESLLPVVHAALENAKIEYKDLSAIAVTTRPGLIGSLIVGVSAAKTLAYTLGIPLIPVNHLEAHLSAVLLENPPIELPALGLIISGGHTSLYEIGDDWKTFRPLGHTRDDAAGEAFDKGARLLGLPYPGGPLIAKHAEKGNATKFSFPRALQGKDESDFSFSGLKTSLSTFLQKMPVNESNLPDICASYQEAIVDSLTSKTIQAITRFKYKHLVIAGGVAANQRLREKIKAALPSFCTLHIPPPNLCTDNGAMIAAIGAVRFTQKNFLQGEDFYSLEPSPRTEAKAARGKQK